MKRIIKITVAVLIVLSSAFMTVSAATPQSYVYNSKEKAIAVPEPYEVVNYLNGEFYGKRLNSPQDMYVCGDTVYILDSGNSRIVCLDENFECIGEKHLIKDGKALEFINACGLFVSKNDKIYVADKDAKAVYVADMSGNVEAEITAPDKSLTDEYFEFNPISVVADSAGIVYVISSGSYSGALQYDEQYRFLGFYGSEEVEVTAKVLMNEFWKKILSEEAASGLTRNVPTSIIALDIDEGNFIYTLRADSVSGKTGQIKRLNTLSGNILLNEEKEQGTYGDTDTYFDSGKNLTVSTSLVDIAVDESGFIIALDRTYSRLFEYSQKTDLLFAFGGNSKKRGNFSSPVAVETYGDKLLVLDDKEASLTVMKPTLFGSAVRSATALNEDGKYSDAAKYWKEVLKYDTYYPLANKGMGTVSEELGEYTKAMNYYRIADYKEGYSSAFALKRDIWLKNNFIYVFFGTIAVMAALVGLTYLKEKHKKNAYSTVYSKYRYPLYCLCHPFKAYGEMKQEKKGSLLAANVILTAFAILSVIRNRLTAFHFSGNDPEEFNLIIVLGSSIGIFIMFVLCNWAVSTLFDGEGTLKEIWIWSAYAVLPLVISFGVMTGLSHIFSLEESAFWVAFWVIAIGWTIIHIIMAIGQVHGYTVKKTVLILIVTAVAMYLLLLITVLTYSLFTQLIGFISTVYGEYRLK